MEYELYCAAAVGETTDQFIANLTDADLIKPFYRLQGTTRIAQNGTLTFRTTDSIAGRLTSGTPYFVVDEDGERFGFRISQFGSPIKLVGEKYEVTICQL